MDCILLPAPTRWPTREPHILLNMCWLALEVMGKMARGRQKRETEADSPQAWKTMEGCWAFLESHSKPSESG